MMGSGYFPIKEREERTDYRTLSEAADSINRVVGYYRDVVGDDGQFDNAESDGGAIAQLELAAELIRRNIAR